MGFDTKQKMQKNNFSILKNYFHELEYEHYFIGLAFCIIAMVD